MEWLLIALIFAVLTALAASAKGRSGFAWFVLGFMFNIFAFIAVLVMSSLKEQTAQTTQKAPAETPATHLRCPDCAELVLKAAKVCKHCGAKFPQPTETTSAPTQ